MESMLICSAATLLISMLIMEFEKEFGISIPDDQAEKITTVGEAIELISAAATK